MSATNLQPQTDILPPPNPRRVVTGHDEGGKAILTSDNQLESNVVRHGLRMSNIWTTESVPTQDNNSSVDQATRPIPGLGLVLPNGINHRFTDLAPGTTTPMHRTNSVDYNILISGRLDLIVEDDVRTELQPGNVVVQRGTLHAWHNPSDNEWARLVSVLIHADSVKVDGTELKEVWG